MGIYTKQVNDNMKEIRHLSENGGLSRDARYFLGQLRDAYGKAAGSRKESGSVGFLLGILRDAEKLVEEIEAKEKNRSAPETEPS